MKRLLTFSILAVLATVLFASCSKRDHYDNSNSEYAYIDNFYDGYPFAVVQYESDNTYGIIENKFIEDPVSIDDRLYGDFYEGGYRDVKNITANYRMPIRVRENGLGSAAAADVALNYYCDEYDGLAGLPKNKNRILISQKGSKVMRSKITIAPSAIK